MTNSSNFSSDAAVAVHTITYDGSTDGFLCAADWVCTHLASQPVQLSPGAAQPQDLFAAPGHTTRTNAQQAEAFYRNLQQRGGKQAARNVLFAFMAMDAPRETLLLGYVRKLLQYGPNVDQRHAEPEVATVHRYARKVAAEIHRFKGLLRFFRLQDGRLLALYTPDYDITLFLAWHFARRLRSQAWVILDTLRQCAATWNGSILNAEDPQHQMLTGSVLQQLLQTCTPDPDDKLIQQQWRVFYRSVAIENRTNPALRRRCMPLRYWKHLTELEASAG